MASSRGRIDFASYTPEECEKHNKFFDGVIAKHECPLCYSADILVGEKAAFCPDCTLLVEKCPEDKKA
jgi:hypothetical protein